MEKKKITWWQIAGLIILFAIIFNWIGGSDNDYEDYEYCVERCVSDNSYCIYGAEQFLNGGSYLVGDDAIDCTDELEYCIEDCKR